ncbi:MAG: hypothetical protein IPP97_09585 [Candidatus Obscuribacter sp.]|nr:hypothetical protein [Candidatus Obscuribacter sp.]
MSLGTIIILLIVVFGLYHVVTAPQRRVSRDSNIADDNLALGGQALLVNDLARAERHFYTALSAARSANHPLWFAEANYGLAQVAAKRGDYANAVSYIDQALSKEHELGDGFDNYVSLLKRIKEEYQDKL